MSVLERLLSKIVQGSVGKADEFADALDGLVQEIESGAQKSRVTHLALEAARKAGQIERSGLALVSGAETQKFFRDTATEMDRLCAKIHGASSPESVLKELKALQGKVKLQLLR